MKEIAAWLKKAFKVSKIRSGEANFPCPKCGHESFYFNLRKKIGYCHFAGCHWKPRVEDLVGIVGFGPDEEAGYVPGLEEEPVIHTQVSLPPDAKPVCDNVSYLDKFACSALYFRGILGEDAYHFRIYANQNFIYIPVWEGSKLVQYVGRAIDRNKHPNHAFQVDGRRYDYFKGNHISNYIFNWDEAKDWDQLILVENTFNAIRWRGHYVTTNFGSHLSDIQINKLKRSKIRTICLLWDEGTKEIADQTCKRLRKAGIPSAFGIIKGQPDDYDHAKPTHFFGQLHYNIVINPALRYIDFTKQPLEIK